VAAGQVELQPVSEAVRTPAEPPLPSFPVQLVLDDNELEARVGVSDGSAHALQLLWFNRFSPAVPVRLEEVWVLFPFDPSGQLGPGSAIQLAVWEDLDGDPSNGADLLASWNETVQAADGVSFSIYTVTPPVVAGTDGADVLIGVVNRYVTSGVTPSSSPAGVDTSTVSGRSWLGLWSTDPPDPPLLTTLPDQAYAPIDDLGLPGTWMIRGFGSVAAQAPGVPLLGRVGLAITIVLLAACGVLALGRLGRHGPA
jgi:hypothetical protein